MASRERKRKRERERERERERGSRHLLRVRVHQGRAASRALA
jgi:hypothetical protein